ncbi:hypothetical protein FXO37_17732 [Capsicum annuum]|nr:hypothetical protein FXO37_17732 [Capsicum annuum]
MRTSLKSELSEIKILLLGKLKADGDILFNKKSNNLQGEPSRDPMVDDQYDDPHRPTENEKSARKNVGAEYLLLFSLVEEFSKSSLYSELQHNEQESTHVSPMRGSKASISDVASELNSMPSSTKVEAKHATPKNHDCGAFVCAFVEYVIHGRDIPKEIDIGYIHMRTFVSRDFVIKSFMLPRTIHDVVLPTGRIYPWESAGEGSVIQGMNFQSQCIIRKTQNLAQEQQLI